MRTFAFASRCRRELLRDPLTVAFGLGFPLVLLYLLSLLQRNIPIPMFEVDTLAPGVAAFGLTFIALFSAMLVSKDRTRSLMMRLCASPMQAQDFILGYLLPMLPLALGQSLVCFLFAIPLGLTVSGNILFAILGIIPMAVFNISLGLLFGSLLGVKQVGGVCGALLTNLSAWLSGVWFDLELVGGVFEAVAHALPFYHAVELEQALFRGDFDTALPHLLVAALYSILAAGMAVWCFLGQMKKQ